MCKHLNLSDTEAMHYFIQSLHPNLKSHVILGEPKSFSEAENLANLKEAVSINTANKAQQKLEVQFASVAKCLETLAAAQQKKASNVAAYSAF